jgi:uncharacterized protein (TIGR02001 family)
MKTLFRTCAAAALIVVPAMGFAQSKAAPEYTFSGNAGLFSDYRFRGYTQTDEKPAFQGGFDFAHKSGFYLGNWNSNVSSVLYNGASLEMDFYGGYKTSVGDLGLDIGVLYYYYPGTGKYLTTYKPENGEFYIGGSYGPISLKYFHSFTDFFGLNSRDLGLPGPEIDSKGSQYLDLSATMDLGDGYALNGHIGYQKVKNYKLFGSAEDTTFDYKVGITKDLSGWILGAAVQSTSEENFFLTTDGKDGGKTRGVVSLSKTF